MSEGEGLLGTIQAVHAAGVAEVPWPQVLAGLAALLGSAAASLEVFTPPLQRPREFHAFGIPPAGELAYLEQYAALNPRAAYAFQHAGRKLLWDYQVLDERAMDRDPFYTWMRPQMQFRYFLACQFYCAPGELVGVSVHRTRKQGHVGSAEIAQMGRLLPHFRQAFDSAMRLKRAATFGKSLEVALDWLSDGVALVAADGRVLFANQSLQAIARRNDGVRLRSGTIEFGGSARTRFNAALASVTRMRSGDCKAPLPGDFPVERASVPPYLVSVRPLVHAAGESEAAAIVFVHDPLRRYAGMLRVLHDVFGLTEAEAHVANALQCGMSLGQYARERRVSLNTVYTHVRHIKDKTGCRRLTELVCKLNELQLPLRVRLTEP